MFSTVINFGMLGLLHRLYRLQIQFTLQSESNEAASIMFPNIQKHHKKEGKKGFVKHSLTDLTDVKTFEAVERARMNAKASLEVQNFCKNTPCGVYTLHKPLDEEDVVKNRSLSHL